MYYYKPSTKILYSVEGTVRPDWICMRVVPLESPLKDINRYIFFIFFISVLNI
jgi:hypothetical protein